MIFAGWRDNFEFQEPIVIMSHCIKKKNITESKHKLKKKNKESAWLLNLIMNYDTQTM